MLYIFSVPCAAIINVYTNPKYNYINYHYNSQIMDTWKELNYKILGSIPDLHCNFFSQVAQPVEMNTYGNNMR